MSLAVSKDCYYSIYSSNYFSSKLTWKQNLGCLSNTVTDTGPVSMAELYETNLKKVNIFEVWLTAFLLPLQ